MTAATETHTAWRPQMTPAEVAALAVNEGARTIMVNRPPAITWHKLKINEVAASLPALPAAARTAVEVASGDAVWGAEAEPFDAALAEADPEGHFESGMGAEAEAWLSAHTAERVLVDVAAGEEPDPVLVHLDAEDGAASVCALDIIVREGARATVYAQADAPAGGTGVAGFAIRALVGEGAHLSLVVLQTLDDGYTYLENTAALLGAGAHAAFTQTELGARRSLVGTAFALDGDESSVDIDTHYLGHGENDLDFNYVIRQRGRATKSNLDANGSLADASSKILRGTIDFIHGCKGAVGHERDTVLLANDKVRNKTMPVLLCDEDDVQGDHGASIGHVNPEQLGYLEARGLSESQVEALFVGAQFDYAAVHAFDERAAAGVNRLAQRVIGREAGAQLEGEA